MRILTVLVAVLVLAGCVGGYTTTRTFTVNWEGEFEAMEGELLIDDFGQSGTLTAELPDGEGDCAGEFELTGRLRGDWTLDCSNGLSASGTFVSFGRTKGVEGEGVDALDRAVTVIVGPAH